MFFTLMKDDDPEFAHSSSSENDDDADVSSVVYMVLVFLLKWIKCAYKISA